MLFQSSYCRIYYSTARTTCRQFSISAIRAKSKTATHTTKAKLFFDTNETSDKIQFALHSFEINLRENLRSYRKEYGDVNINQEIFALMKKVSEDEKQRQIRIQQSKQGQETSTGNETSKSGSMTSMEAISENSQVHEIFSQKVLKSPMYFFNELAITLKNNNNTSGTLEETVFDARCVLKPISYSESYFNFLRQLDQFSKSNEVSTEENGNEANEVIDLIDAYLSLPLPLNSSHGQIKTTQLEFFMNIILNNSGSMLQSFGEEARLNHAHKLIQIFEKLIMNTKSPLRIDEFNLFLQCCQVRDQYDLKIPYVISILTKLEQVLGYTEKRYIVAVSDSLLANAETTSIEEARKWSVYVNGLNNDIKLTQGSKCYYIVLKVLEYDPQSAEKLTELISSITIDEFLQNKQLLTQVIQVLLANGSYLIARAILLTLMELLNNNINIGEIVTENKSVLQTLLLKGVYPKTLILQNMKPDITDFYPFFKYLASLNPKSKKTTFGPNINTSTSNSQSTVSSIDFVSPKIEMQKLLNLLIAFRLPIDNVILQCMFENIIQKPKKWTTDEVVDLLFEFIDFNSSRLNSDIANTHDPLVVPSQQAGELLTNKQVSIVIDVLKRHRGFMFVGDEEAILQKIEKMVATSYSTSKTKVNSQSIVTSDSDNADTAGDECFVGDNEKLLEFLELLLQNVETGIKG
ncbi:unnamed protein product [Ambrosiozyma monospora]|uniref:Unnamed protein product n=1 Tax=Ambrosiozyma monospora TaxID=43982 RepID=A0A9W6Z1F4_AMBMO|nr:unnamed protein product [Ambrosiozyma monospora]